MLCQDCHKKPTCKKLCKKAERYVNQDYVYQRERVTHHKKLEVQFYRSLIKNQTLDERVDFPFLTPLQNKCLHMFYFDGLSYAEIARALSGNPSKMKINHSTVRGLIYRAKRKIRDFFPIRGGGKNV